MVHSLATGSNAGIHVPYNWIYADATSRNAATGFVATDEGKFARQIDDNSIWMLISVGSGPAYEWRAVSADLSNLNASNLTSGTIPAARFRSGQVIQYVYNTLAPAAINTTSSSFQYTGLSLTIPSMISGSKVRLRLSGGSAAADNGESQIVIIKRSINGGSETDITPGGADGLERIYNSGGITSRPHNIVFIDSPSTALSTEYKVYYRAGVGGSSTAYFEQNAIQVMLEAEEIAQ